MSNFEDILRDSAARLSTEENKHLCVPRNPMQHPPRTYWGWIATPIAAAAGVILGLFLPILSGKADEAIHLAQTPDTIRITEHINDTIYLSQVVEKEKIVEKIRYVKLPIAPSSTAKVPSAILPASTRDLSQQETPTCTSIQCDGINYSLLVSH